MRSESDDEQSGGGCGGLFTTTHWSVVLRAGQEKSPRAAAALEQLCRTYWYPLYVYARRHGHGPEDAEDLVQGFFLQLLRGRTLAAVDPHKGLFRSFLLAGLKYYMADCRDKACSQKRGGGQAALPFDVSNGETRYVKEPKDNLSPDKIYERQWVMALLEQVLARLALEYKESDKAEHFAGLRQFLVEGGRGTPYAEVGAQLGLTEEAVKKAVQRLRQRYGELIREELTHTLTSPTQVEEELRYLHAIMAG